MRFVKFINLSEVSLLSTCSPHEGVGLNRSEQDWERIHLVKMLGFTVWITPHENRQFNEKRRLKESERGRWGMTQIELLRMRERENNISVFITEVDSSRRLAEKYPPHSKDPVY